MRYTTGLTLLVLMTSGCSMQSNAVPGVLPIPVQQIEVEENPIPGTVKELWAESMYDNVEVPGQIDPTNTYYRLPHKTVVEIRPERYQKVQFGTGAAATPPSQ